MIFMHEHTIDSDLQHQDQQPPAQERAPRRAKLPRGGADPPQPPHKVAPLQRPETRAEDDLKLGPQAVKTSGK